MKSFRLKFGVGMLFVITACEAGYMSGYEWGSDDRRQEEVDKKITTRSYNVDDIIAATGDVPVATQLKTLCKLLEQTIDPDGWKREGMSITVWERSKTLTIVQSGKQHSNIEKLFASLRQLQAKHRKAGSMKTGDRIRLVHTDDHGPVPKGSLGTIVAVNLHTDWHQVDVDWDDGRRLMLTVPPNRVEAVQ